MGDGRRRRGTARHAGVVIVARRRSGGVSWLGRFTDPDTGRRREVTIPDGHEATEELRQAWAEWKAGELGERGRQLEEGAPVKTGRTLADVVAEYYRQNEPRLRASTATAYRQGTDLLLAYAAERQLALADELRGQHLEAFRAWLFSRPRLVQQKGGKRGGRSADPERKLSPVGINSRLRSVKTVLDAVRRLGLVPMLTHDHIRDALRAEREPRPLPDYLRPAQIRALLLAALRHDAGRFDLTREEKAAGAPGGKTPKYEPIAPFVAFVLLTGMRFEEARVTRWGDVDLAAAPAGTIHVGTESKTGHARLVDLVVSPVLVRLLKALKLRAGEATHVFGGVQPVTRDVIEKARKRLVADFGAPAFSWQILRATCGTFLANAAGIFGGASAYREARQLGHSVQVAEKHYLGVVHVERDSETLEDAMAVKDVLGLVVRSASGERVKLPSQKAIQS